MSFTLLFFQVRHSLNQTSSFNLQQVHFPIQFSRIMSQFLKKRKFIWFMQMSLIYYQNANRHFLSLIYHIFIYLSYFFLSKLIVGWVCADDREFVGEPCFQRSPSVRHIQIVSLFSFLFFLFWVCFACCRYFDFGMSLWIFLGTFLGDGDDL